MTPQLAARGQVILAETQTNQAPVDTTPIVEAPITVADKSHWSFGPVVRPPLPAVKNGQWLGTPVDAFILAKLEDSGLGPAEEASRATVLRRVSFDLTGLPPTPEELATFESDNSPDAYERLLDRLLASPTYGERYGQYWLDLARFAETDGFEHDKIRPDSWQYRDWVIAALNADMPYDEFVRLQVAGDEGTGDGGQGAGESENPKSEIATMFCLAGPDMPDINDQAERRHNRLNELTATVGSVFLGLQMGCAQCHDHKYDPITQGDFYRLRAVFEPAVAELKRDKPYLVLARQPDSEPARLWIRGDHRRPGPIVQPGFPRIASATTHDSPLTTHHSTLTTHALRTSFAAWLTGDDNPLTSRVMANRVWQRHFGRGICETPSDFGAMSANPTHPELLDWLAVELRERGWALKRMHRVIAASATYRQAAMNSEFNIQNSELYGRFPRKRLEGEAIRDAMLGAAGLLTSERGGPGVMPPLPQELVGTLLKGQWKASEREADHYKRSVYVFARRNLRYPIFEAFDRPDANASCPIRNRSTTAPQSLLLFNSEFSLLAARRLAERVVRGQKSGIRSHGSAAEQIERMYLIVLSRKPTADEAATFEAFLRDQEERLTAEGRPADERANAAIVDACLALFNSNEFIYID
jgi:hypothetical protein